MHEGTVKLKLPKRDAGKFRLNLDGSGHNMSEEGVHEATLFLSLDGGASEASILLTRKTESKFRS